MPLPNRIKLFGKKIKWRRREGEGKKGRGREEGRGRRKGEEKKEERGGNERRKSS